MNDDYTLNPVKLAQALHGLSDQDRRSWVQAAISRIVADLPGLDTTCTLNASRTFWYLRSALY